MRFHEDGIRDRRTRFYCPVRRCLTSAGVTGAERLVGCLDYQPVIHYLPEPIVFSPGGHVLLDFGEALHGGIRINLVGKAGKLRLTFGESVSEATGVPDLDSSRRKAVVETPNYGMIEYGNTVFRFVHVENVGETDIKCLGLMAVALECDLEVTGSFESSDPRLNQIWKTAVRTVHLCMQDFIYDGSKRDRIVWMGDMHPEVRGILCAFSDRSIVRDSFEFLMGQATADKPVNQINTYSCWFIVSVWEYYMATGDRAFLKAHGEYFRLMLETFAGFVDGEGRECVPGRRFLDWPNDGNLEAKHAGIQALMVWMMVNGEKILRELGMDSSVCRTALEKLRRHVPDPAGRKAPAALLTLMGLANRQDVLEQDPFRDVSTFYGYYVLLAKKTVPALELIRRYWGAMLDLGATSFWEDFNLDWAENSFGIDSLPVPGKRDIHADFGNYCYKGLRHSLSHGWSCGPAPFLSERVLGVRFLSPGGLHLQVKPDLGDLEWVRGTVPTAAGIVSVSADRSGHCEVDAPAGVNVVRE